MLRRTLSLILIATQIYSPKTVYSQEQESESKKIDKKESDYAKQLANLTKTKTVFFYKNRALLESFKQVISESWNVTEIIFADINRIEEYFPNKDYSYFKIENPVQGTSILSNYFFLSLYLPKEEKRKPQRIYKIQLFRNYIVEMEESLRGGAKLYDLDPSYFHSLSPILLKAKLSVASENLKHNSRPWVYTNSRISDLTERLSNDTLYVPESLAINIYFPDYREKDFEKNVFIYYKFKFRICSNSELYEIFETQKRGRLLYEYSEAGQHEKFITIYDLKDKIVLYNRYIPMTPYITRKDIESIE